MKLTHLSLSALFVFVLLGAGCQTTTPTPVITPGLSAITSTPVNTVSTTPVVAKPSAAAVPKGWEQFSDAKRKLSFRYPVVWTKVVSANTATDFLVEFKTRYEVTNILAQTIVRVSQTSQTQAAYNEYIKATLASYGPKKEGEEYSLTFESFAGFKNVLHLRSTNTKESPAYADTYAIVTNGQLYVFSYQSFDTGYANDVVQFAQLLKSVVIK